MIRKAKLFILVLVSNLLFFGMLSTSHAGLAEQMKDEGLVAYYKFDEGQGTIASDASKYKNDGKINGATWIKVSRGYALEFDGINDYVDCGSPPSLNISGSITTMAWICPAELQTAKEAGILGKQLSSYLITYYLNRKFYWYINSGENNVNTTVMPNIWSHIATTFNGRYLELYVNGELAAKGISKFETVNSGENFLIGCTGRDINTTAFKGLIDDVRIYNRALSGEEIQAQFKANEYRRNEMLAEECISIKTGESIESGAISVRAGAYGAIQIDNGKSFCILESNFSYPGLKIGINTFSTEKIGGEKSWSPQAKKINGKTLLIEASGEHYSLRRNIQLKNERIEIKDTFTNLKNVPVGIIISHRFVAPEVLRNARAMATADNPTIFFSQKDGDFGILGEDSVSRLQFESSCRNNMANLRHSSFALDSGKSYTFQYAIYPLEPTGDIFNFVNRIRKDWDTNFTVQGPFDWISIPTFEPLRDHTDFKKYFKRKKCNILLLAPWLDYEPYSIGYVLPRDEYKTMMQKAAKTIRELAPEIKILGCIESDWATIYPEKIRNGDRLPGVKDYTYQEVLTPEQTKIIEDANLPWRDSFKRDINGNLTLELYVSGGKPQVALAVYSTPGNYQHKFLFDQARFLIEDVGLDGVYLDQFSQLGETIPVKSYGGWDGVSVDIDPDTGKIINKYTNCSLVGIKSRVDLINFVLSRKKTVIANTYASSQEEQSLPVQRFGEMQSDLNLALLSPGKKPPLVYEMCGGILGTPIGIGVTSSPEQPHLAKGLMLAIMSYLRHGLVYYHYLYPEIPEEGIYSGEYGPINHMFPITPVGLHEGWIEGKERIITAISGTYNWRNEKKPNIYLFDLCGRTKEHNFETSKTKDGWEIKIDLKDWEEIVTIEE